MAEQNPFKWRHFQSDIILLCVRWYVRSALSYRDLEEMMLERGLHVDHTTIYRWVQYYAPELEKRCRPHLKACNDSRTSRRDLHQNQKGLVLPLSSCRL
jgi:transposase-like protein